MLMFAKSYKAIHQKVLESTSLLKLKIYATFVNDYFLYLYYFV